MIECFKDSPFLKTITLEDSLVRKILTHPCLKKNEDGDTFHIPYLMLVGVLFCASNVKVKGSKFFELCQMELNPQISAGDKELRDYYMKLLQISY
mmetsp:Transcript_7186/g.6280  ORF Transcript_7186/g.6280 Transcript_7186/m.6280 type:complete len:95 (+) Transcript_7186:257-541(+)